LEAGDFDRFAPHRNVGGNHGSELDRSIAERINAEGGKTVGTTILTGFCGQICDDAGSPATRAMSSLLSSSSGMFSALPLVLRVSI